jgi:hypothetical protein
VTPRASVVIPNWNGAALLADCLASLRAQTFTDFETIVVDNGSTDLSLALLAAEFPEVRVVALASNEGFARATNAGLRAARGAVLVCLNNDVRCEPGWLAALIAALEAHPEAGAVASKMLDARRPGVIDSAGDAMALVAWNVGRGAPDGPAFATGREILTACAGAAAYRRALIEAVGDFDEAYFAWFEDVDLGLRAQLAGFRCWYEPGAVVHHLGSATAATLGEWKMFHTVRNGMYLFFKTMPGRRIAAWGGVMLVWPWLAPLTMGYPLRVCARAWFAFWPMVPALLRGRRAAYRRGRAEVPRVLALLESPLADFRRALAVLRARLRGAA